MLKKTQPWLHLTSQMLLRKHLQQHYCKYILLHTLNDSEWCGWPQIIQGDKTEPKMFRVCGGKNAVTGMTLTRAPTGGKPELNQVVLAVLFQSCHSSDSYSLWPLTVESWVHFQFSPWGVCGGQSSTGSGLFPIIQFFTTCITPPVLHTHSFIYHPCHIILTADHIIK
jgi:hypothetical protein